MTGSIGYPALAVVSQHLKGPHIDWAAFAPFVTLSAGAVLVLLLGLLRGKVARERVVPVLTILTLLVGIGFEVECDQIAGFACQGPDIGSGQQLQHLLRLLVVVGAVFL